MDTKALKKQMGAAIAMVLVAAVALGSATFAWFVNNTKVKADGATVTAKAANTLLISQGDTGNWGTSAQCGTAETESFVPVSAVKALSFFKDSAWTTETGDTQKGAYNASGFTAATEGADYYKDTFKVKASQACGLYLDSDTKFEMVGSADASALKAMRLALKVGEKVYFYQVEADAISGEGNSYNTTLVSLGADGVAKAIDSASTAAAIGADNMTSDSKVPALSTCTVEAPSDSSTLVEKDDAKKLCDLTANQEQSVDVYVWMEGCDYDCNSTVVKQITEQAMKITLGFCAGKTA